MTARVSGQQRHRRGNPCRVCGGHDQAGKGSRCYGYISTDGRFVHCTRTEFAGSLQQGKDGAFAHILDRPCRCGETHGPASVPPASSGEKDLSPLIGRLWDEGKPVISDDLVDRYLRSRAIDWPGSFPETLRYHPNMLHRSDTDTWHPAMVAAVLNLAGEIVGIHCTYLTSDGHKASVYPDKRMLKGRPTDTISGCAVRLGLPDGQGRLGIAEGIETALSASLLTGLPVWCGLSAVGLENIRLPGEVLHVTIFADHDKNMTGQRAAAKAALRFRAEGRESKILVPDEPGQDFNDILQMKSALQVTA